MGEGGGPALPHPTGCSGKWPRGRPAAATRPKPPRSGTCGGKPDMLTELEHRRLSSQSTWLMAQQACLQAKDKLAFGRVDGHAGYVQVRGGRLQPLPTAS